MIKGLYIKVYKSLKNTSSEEIRQVLVSDARGLIWSLYKIQ